MADEDKSKAKAKPSYGEKMRKKLEDERAKDQANPTSTKMRKRAKKMRKFRK